MMNSCDEPPEFQDLLRVVAAAVGGPEAVPARPVSSCSPVLLALARRHRLLPLFERHGGAAGVEIPDALRSALTLELAGRAARSLLLSAELLRVMAALEARGIAAASYKGPVLSMWAYGELGLRTFDDLDILVDRKDLAAAAAALRELGFRMHHPRGDTDWPLAVRTEYHYPFYRESGHVAVELHCRLAPFYFLGGTSARGPLARAVPAPIGIGSVPALAVEDLLVALCFHGAKHAWHWLSLVADVALLVARRPEIDWDVFWQRATLIGARRMALASLHLAASLLAAPVPARFLRAAGQDQEVLAVTRAALSGLHSPDPHPAALAMPRFHLQCLDRTGDKLRYAALSVLAPNWDDIEWVLVPPGLHLIYWVLRPARLVLRRLPPLMRRLAAREPGL